MKHNITHTDQFQKKQKKPVVLILLIVLLTGAIAVMAVMYYNLKTDAQKTEQILVDQKIKLEDELQGMYVEYDSLRTQNDSINLKLEAEQSKIKRLLAVNASNVEKIRLYEKELKTLRKIMRSYIVQIDSLNQRNKYLVEENVQVRTQLRVVEQSNRALSDEKQMLTNKVEKASVLSVKEIIALPLNKRSNEKFKADKVEKIRTCFTVRENPIIPPGPIRIYKRIINPNGVVLVNDPTYIMQYNNENIAYSESREIEYENQDIDVCIFWDKTEEIVEGVYNIELYAQGNMIGSTSFELK